MIKTMCLLLYELFIASSLVAVRLSKDRLSLVAQSVETRANAYKQSEKVKADLCCRIMLLSVVNPVCRKS